MTCVNMKDTNRSYIERVHVDDQLQHCPCFTQSLKRVGHFSRQSTRRFLAKTVLLDRLVEGTLDVISNWCSQWIYIMYWTESRSTIYQS